MHRRQFLLSAAALSPFASRWTTGDLLSDAGPEADFAAIGRHIHGRLGVAVLETASGRGLSYHGNARFPMCSTFKWLLVARVLTRVDRHEEDLTRFIRYSEADLLAYAPVARKHVSEGGLSLSALAEAAVEVSDNTAANLLLDSIGGPAGLTDWLRSIGDQTTRLDRKEPELNSSVPGDVRDTTTPAAMVANLRSILLGKVLSDQSRQRLIEWLKGSITGGARLRAGLPAGWTVGDKTGTGDNGSTNDVAIIWPPDAAPVLVAAYLTATPAKIEERNAALADVARVIVGWMR